MSIRFVVFVASMAIVSCGAPPEAPSPDADAELTGAEAAASAERLPEQIVAQRDGFIPEGVEYDMANGRLLTGSLSEGSIFHIAADGSVTPIISDPELVSSVGIEVDELRARLLVANADRSVFDGGTTGQAMLGVYDLNSGERIAMVDLAATVPHAGDDAAFFANDVAVADDGTAYVTDTRMNAIYRVDTQYQASLFHRFEDGEAGPNGIVEHPSGYLLVARGADLWKVPTDDTGAAAPVTLPQDIPGQDGMVWSAGRLAIVSNSTNRVVALTSGDEWATAQLDGIAHYEPQATTAAVVGDDVYVVHPMFSGDGPPSFSRVSFE